MRRGEIWWANLPEPIGHRPVVLLSRNEAYIVRNAVTVAEVTTVIRDIPVEVLLGMNDDLPKKCVANLDTIMTIHKGLLTKRVCMLSEQRINELNEAIRFALAID